MANGVRYIALAGALLGALTGCGSGSSPSSATAVTTGPYSHVHLLQVQPDGSLVLGDQEGLWHGTSQATGWKPTGPPLNHMMVTCLAAVGHVQLACTTSLATGHVFFGSPRGLWQSTDSGRRWTRNSLADKSVLFLATNPAVAGTVLAMVRSDGSNGAVGHGGIWASRDSGRTWTRIDQAAATSLQPIGLALLPGHPFTVVFADSGHLFISHNGGKSWNLTDLGGSTILSLVVSHADPRIAFASGIGINQVGNIWKGTADGSNWSKVWTVPPTSTLVSAFDQVNDVYGYASANSPYIFRTESSGATAKGTTPLTGTVTIAVDPGNSRRVYAAGSFPLKIYESNDAGNTWKHIL